jgi:membrane-associated protease RseP (regulator of RpoE activity)
VPQSINLGDRFVVIEEREVRDARNRLLARYRPGFEYTATPLNIGIIAAMAAQDKASAVGRSPEKREALLQASQARMSGVADTGK